MIWLRSLCIAFSIYSKIPVPIFEWKDEDMQYHLLFFPWIGALIGGLWYGWYLLCGKLGIGQMAYVCVTAALPLFVTGGFHVDGFMDTMDAFHSYKPKEDKLAILKDPHIGAFAVIMLALLGLLYLAALSELGPALLPAACCSFAVARALSGIAVITFPSAKTSGMLYTFSSTAQSKARSVVLGGLWIQLLIALELMCVQHLIGGLVLSATAAGCFLYYRYRTKKELGGITGDTAGYFVTICECAMLLAAAVLSLAGL